MVTVSMNDMVDVVRNALAQIPAGCHLSGAYPQYDFENDFEKVEIVFEREESEK